MKINDRLVESLGKRKKRLLSLLKEGPGENSELYFHDLRLQLKKLKALFRLISFAVPDFRVRKVYKPFRRLFHAMGQIREYQVEAAIAANYLPDQKDALIKAILKAQASAEKGYLKVIERNLSDQLKTNFMVAERAAAKIKEKDVERYFKYQRRKINRLLRSSPLRESSVHKLRKLLKEYSYNQRLMMKIEGKRSVVPWSTFQKLLGTWHDYEVALSHLREIGQEGKSHATVEAVSHLLFNLTREKAVALERIHKRAKALSMKRL